MKKTNVLKSAAIAALFSLLTLVGCNNAAGNGAGGANYTTSGQIFGYVTDTKGEPLEGVSIALGNLTTTTNSNGAFALTGVPVNATENATVGGAPVTATAGTQTYTLTAKKEGYLPSTLTGILVVETTDHSDAAKLLNTAATAYATILDDFAKVGGTGATAIAAGTAIATDGLIIDTQNTNDTFKDMANAYASILERYQNLSKTYESTFVTTKLTPCNAYVEGTLKITKSPQKNITTDASSIKTAPEGVKVKLVTSATSPATGYVYEATTNSEGKFKFENLPVATALTFKVEGFEYTYESGDGDNKVKETFYYSLTDGSDNGASTNLYDGEDLQENVITSFKLEEKSGAKYKADILLYSQPAKIIATATNLLDSTKVAPLALNTPVTVTFNKPMDYVELTTETGVNTVSETGKDAAYSWDEKKTTVTITPKDGFWSANQDEVTFIIAGRAQDGARSFIDNKFKVKLDNIIKIVFADKSEAAKDSFSLTFDRELVNTSAVTVKDDKNEAVTLAWDLTTATAPVLTVSARDGKFANAGEHTFTIAGVDAKDQSTKITSYSREFDKTSASAATPAYKFKTRFDGFKATSIEVVDKADGTLSRAVVATTAQYLKINFNKNVGDVSGLIVKDGTAAGANTVNVKKYVKDSAVYISLAEFTDDKSIALSGTVYSTSGDAFTGNGDVKWTDLIADYKVRTAYVIAASNLYTVKDSINAGNDVTVNKIKKGESVTLTFNKDIPANAVLETELYVLKDNKLVNMEETGYKATATYTGKTVTVALNETKPATTYYLSLKIKSADGAELFSTGSKSFATGTSVKDVYIEPAIAHTFTGTPTSTTPWVGKKYISITVDTVRLLPEGSSKTTKAAEFKKSSKADVVLQFNQDVTGYKAFLYVNSQVNRNALAKNFVNLSNTEKAYFYGATTSVDKDTITIKPSYSFTTADKPGIAVYDADGEWVELSTTNGTGGNLAPYAPYESKTYTAKLDPDNATQAITITPAKTAGYTAGEFAEVTFKMIAANKYTDAIPQFTLYKKVNKGYGEIEWEKVAGNQTVYKSDKTTLYSYDDFKVDNADAYIKLSDGAFVKYGAETFVLLATVENMVIKTNEFTITK